MKRTSHFNLMLFALATLNLAFSSAAVRAQAITGAQLASTCRSEANIEADDPRYGQGYCLSFLQHTLSVLRGKGTCDNAIDAYNVESDAIKAFMAGMKDHPDLGSKDAEAAAESILANYFGCDK